MESIIYLTEEEIKSAINIKALKKGIELVCVEIDNTIKFSGNTLGKLKSKFNGEIFIKGVQDGTLVIKLLELNVSKIGVFKVSNIFITKLINKIVKKKYININESEMLVDIEKLEERYCTFSISIEDVYIKDKHLIIKGKNLETYLIG
ncbi:hypothetical protein [Clostridium sp.]|uniref:hypothetical protein n=1 Tax=Clostridium sp. TaxID=1506 RepID=UPI003F3E77E9